MVLPMLPAEISQNGDENEIVAHAIGSLSEIESYRYLIRKFGNHTLPIITLEICVDATP